MKAGQPEAAKIGNRRLAADRGEIAVVAIGEVAGRLALDRRDDLLRREAAHLLGGRRDAGHDDARPHP